MNNTIILPTPSNKQMIITHRGVGKTTTMANFYTDHFYNNYDSEFIEQFDYIILKNDMKCFWPSYAGLNKFEEKTIKNLSNDKVAQLIRNKMEENEYYGNETRAKNHFVNAYFDHQRKMNNLVGLYESRLLKDYKENK